MNKCNNCVACILICPEHVLLPQKKSSTPVVALPMKCVDDCRECALSCPKGAISFAPIP